MRVSDEDLERAAAMLAVDVTDDNASLLGDAIVSELLALRKVADAARAVADTSEETHAGEAARTALEAALKAAGL